jgi:acyl-CoA reductase-like NAD-dependent aldehyde dehydrogenase
MSDTLTVYSAWTREPVRELAYNSAADAENYLKKSVELLKQGSLLKHRRIDILEKASVLISKRAEALAKQIALEGGKP